jgi:asparagine synthase (glutamine-hydrolysing)
MIAAMAHRGPDDYGSFRGDGIALGMTRLSILDLTPAGHQPMSNPDQTVWIVYNGEAYNFRDERKILESRGYTFRSTSDTEVVLRMYEHYGDDFLLRIRGMFALAIYDKRRGRGRERLILARDHLGIKPLLYARAGSCFVFASEMKALLASGLIRPEIDPVALRLLLTFGSVYQPRTMIKGVSMLLPAHRLLIEGGRERIERYWRFGIDRRPDLRCADYQDQVAEMSRVIEESVALQMVSDVPLGAFLSGGVDSSLLVAMMARRAGHKIKTFSVGFGDEGSHIDETDDAERTAAFLGTDHTRVVVSGNDVRDRILHIVRGLDQPTVDGVNSYFVSYAARQSVTVAISGTGGDEIFGGYPWFITMVLADRNNRKLPLWRFAADFVMGNVARLPLFDRFVLAGHGPRLSEARNRFCFLTRYAHLYYIFGSVDTVRLLSREIRGDSEAGRAPVHDLNGIDELRGASVVQRVSALCLRGYTNNQLLRDIDAVSMAHSLEVRVPYLDPVLVDYALSLHDSAKVGNLHGVPMPETNTYRATGAKRILIDVGKPLLPKDFDNQPKRGFGMPFDAWLTGPLREVLEDALDARTVRLRGLFDVEAVSSIRESFIKGSIGWPQPWLLMILELWQREVLETCPVTDYSRGP